MEELLPDSRFNQVILDRLKSFTQAEFTIRFLKMHGLPMVIRLTQCGRKFKIGF
jgi:hypothetical protein